MPVTTGGAEMKDRGGVLATDKSAKLAPGWLWLLAGIVTIFVLAVLIGVIIWGPPHLVDRGKASDDAYLKAITDTRTTLVQAAGGFAVFAGVLVGLITLAANRQALQETLKFNRESLDRTAALTERGQITDRFTKAIEQLGRSGKESLDLRLGGIYALEQIALDSAGWHNPVVEVLAAFVRASSVGWPDPGGATNKEQLTKLWTMPEQERFQVMRLDIAAALDILGRRDRKKDARGLLDLTRVDFRRTQIKYMLDLTSTSFDHARLQFSSLLYVDLQRCVFIGTDLRGAVVYKADLRDAYFFRAELEGLDFEAARLDGSRFEDCDLTGVQNLTLDQLKVAKIDEKTKLPPDIKREALTPADAEKPTPASAAPPTSS